LPSTIQKLHTDRQGQPFTVLAINIKESASRVADWVKANRVTVPVLLDLDGAVTGAYRVTGTPTVVLIGRDGRLVARAVGVRSWNDRQGRGLLDALVGTTSR
jgi:hypothetical protein